MAPDDPLADDTAPLRLEIEAEDMNTIDDYTNRRHAHRSSLHAARWSLRSWLCLGARWRTRLAPSAAVALLVLVVVVVLSVSAPKPTAEGEPEGSSKESLPCCPTTSTTTTTTSRDITTAPTTTTQPTPASTTTTAAATATTTTTAAAAPTSASTTTATTTESTATSSTSSTTTPTTTTTTKATTTTTTSAASPPPPPSPSPPPPPPPQLFYDYRTVALDTPFKQFHNANDIVNMITTKILTSSKATRPGGSVDDSAACVTCDDTKIPMAWIPDWFGHGEGIVGKSVLGADIYALVVGNATAERAVYVQGGLHAREWISPASILGTLHILAEKPTAAMVDMLKNVALYVVVMANPDGYDYSITTNRMWRKNRNPNTNVDTSMCPRDMGTGVDLNRNWGSHWAGADGDASPCSNAYRGASAFSEPETAALRDFVLKLVELHYLGAGVDFHSYGQLIMRQPGWTPGVAPFVSDAVQQAQQAIGERMRDAVVYNGGPSYTVENAAKLYPVGGSADDWLYTKAESEQHIGMAVELRPCYDCNSVGFTPAASTIEPTSKDVLAMTAVLIDEVSKMQVTSSRRRRMMEHRLATAAA